MLKISTPQSDATRIVFELEGKLAGPWVQELAGCWEHAVAAGQQVKVLLKAVTFIDEPGSRLLTDMFRHGAEIAAEGCMTKAIVQDIMRGARE